MELVREITTTGSLKVYKANIQTTVRKVLEDVGLENKFFVILVNGKQADPLHLVNQHDEITILPRIAGG